MAVQSLSDWIAARVEGLLELVNCQSATQRFA